MSHPPHGTAKSFKDIYKYFNRVLQPSTTTLSLTIASDSEAQGGAGEVIIPFVASLETHSHSLLQSISSNLLILTTITSQPQKSFNVIWVDPRHLKVPSRLKTINFVSRLTEY